MRPSGCNGGGSPFWRRVEMHTVWWRTAMWHSSLTSRHPLISWSTTGLPTPTATGEARRMNTATPCGRCLRVLAADVHGEALDEGALMRVLATMAPVAAEQSSSRPVLGWDTVPLSPADQAAAIESVKRELDSLDNYWRAQDGRTSPLSRGLADPRVEPIEEWPQTRVEVSFTHPSYPEGRLRRTLRVFDDAGRAGRRCTPRSTSWKTSTHEPFPSLRMRRTGSSISDTDPPASRPACERTLAHAQTTRNGPAAVSIRS